MKLTICDRCGVDYTNDCYGSNIKLKDTMDRGENIIKFKITLNVHASQQIITPKGSENIHADICPNCAIELLLKDCYRNLDYNS